VRHLAEQLCQPETKPEPEPNPYAADAGLGWKAWLAKHFPHVATAPMAERHERVWEWFDAIQPGEQPPRPRVEIWPRGGAKSTTIELGTAYVGARLARQFVLYISETQAQADEHVQSIADHLESLGIKRLVGEFGNARGWRKGQLRTKTGFNVVALGLDTAARGLKLGKFRPDLIVLDDIDGTEDTSRTIAKKIRAITKKLLPAGSGDCAVIVAQNLVHEDGIVAQLYDGRADFLEDRDCFLDVAVRGLQTEPRTDEDGATRHYIVGGTPTWVGQSIEVCQSQIQKWGLLAFLEEAQHEVHALAGYFFDEKQFQIVDEFPTLLRVVRAWDTAATQGGGDYTVGVLMGISANGVLWVLDVVRAQLSSDNVQRLMDLVTEWDRSIWGNRYTLRIPQDPGSAGKRVAELDRRRLEAKAEAVTGSKATRAKTWQRKVNEGNARILSDGRERTPEVDEFLHRVTRGTDLEGKASKWNRGFMTEHRKFQEDESHDFDDQVDASADACNELIGKPSEAPASTPIIGHDHYREFLGGQPDSFL
jgi:phage terminase large subunit-like protein